jgi:hypothetical protein
MAACVHWLRLKWCRGQKHQPIDGDEYADIPEGD